DDDGGSGGGGDVYAIYSLKIDGTTYNGTVSNEDRGGSIYGSTPEETAIIFSIPKIPIGDDMVLINGGLVLDANNNPNPLGLEEDSSILGFTYNYTESNPTSYGSIEGSLTLTNLRLTPMPAGKWAKFKLDFSGTFKNSFDGTTKVISGTVEIVGEYIE